jgi:hypothetical protein
MKELRMNSTLLSSPEGRYVVVVGTPREVWGNYVVEFALWAVASPLQLRYYRAGHAAHALQAPLANQTTFFYWSSDGEWLTFYEVRRQHTYQVVFIQAATGQAYRLPSTNDLLLQLPVISQNGPHIAAFLQQEEVSATQLLPDDVPAELRLR